ncbi:acylphosphatase [Thermovibrio ammonificans]|uniref:acylphosphatase n=1 Tax=Thermovibrio ammonificans (strain DSM 15698 / JCM 12110 / HB-1) TaxID=648996 RepID=E8T4R4_THEA1|nr:acylphosphatase [Thermovibrio ammonificans]ADU96326.1 acylphosphatase [Thermovibrio ammonificans HB-1]
MAVKAIHAFVSGRVQGVGYRAFTRKVARELGLVGFVRNLPDGRVEVYAEGEEEKLQELLRHLKKGPYFARVDSIEVTTTEPRGGYEEFVITY